MRTSRIIFFIILCIGFAFLHVFLQTELIKLGYTVKQGEDQLHKLVEDNHVLQYNICVLESPYHLQRCVSTQNDKLQLVEPVDILSLGPAGGSGGEQEQEAQVSRLENSFFLSLGRFFAGKTAEAKTIR